MLTETTKRIVDQIHILDSHCNELRAIVYDAACAHSNRRSLIYREKSVRGCIRNLNGIGEALVSQRAGVSTRYMNVRLSRGIENLNINLERLQTALGEGASIQSESVKRIQSLMAEMSSCISEIIADTENLSDEIENCYFNRLREDSFGYELTEESGDYNY